MRKMKYWFILFFIGVLFSGCAPQSNQEESNPFVIGFCQLGNESTWRERNTQSVMEAFESDEYRLIYKNAYQKQSEQIKALRSFIAARVDLIVLAPIVETGWETVLKEAQEANIPVLLNDRNIQIEDDSLYLTRVGGDFYQQGVKAAAYLNQKYSGSDQTISLVEIQGSPDSTPTIQRHFGFFDTLDSHLQIEVKETADGDFMVSKGKEAIDQIDKEHGLENIDVIYSHNDDMTMGILEYLEQTSITPGEDILLISVDAQQKAIDQLIAGKINCDVECNPNTGEQILAVIKLYQAGKIDEIEKSYDLKEAVFTEFDDLAKIQPRGY